MKRIVKLVMILGTFFMLSCMDMYNELADEFEGYDYFLAVADQSSILRTYSLDSNFSINFSSKKSITVTNPRLISGTPVGDYLLMPDGTNNTLSVYSVDSAGTLQIVGTPVATEGTLAMGSIVHPSGKYVYVTNQNSNEISMFSINESGLLTKIAEPISTGSYPQRMAIHPSGNTLYATLNSGGGIAVCQINSSGEITSATTFSLSTNTYDLAIHPNGKYIYISASTNGIYKYSIKNDGTLDSTSGIQLTSANYTSSHLAVDPDGNYLYSAKGQYVRILSIDPVSGNLTYLSEAYNSGSGSISDLIIHPSGEKLYASDYGGSHLYSLTASQGNINFDSYFDTGMSYSSLALIRKKK